MNNEILQQILTKLNAIEADVKDLKQGQAKLEQEVSGIRIQQKEHTQMLSALKHASEMLDAKFTVRDTMVAELDSLKLDVAKHEGRFAAMKEAVS